MRQDGRVLAGALLGVALLAWAGPCWGQVCSASGTGEAFGTYNPFSPSPTTSTATLTITCQATVAVLVSYTVMLTAGGSGSVAGRSMSKGGESLPYQLYRDSARTLVWGDGNAGLAGVADSYLLGVVAPVVRPYAVYGAIPAGIQVTPGSYGDVVMVVIAY